jgi:hypothetical protein
MSKETLKLALEALKGIHVGNMTPMAEEYWNIAIKALEEALAKQEQGEPVGTAGELFTNTALERLDFRPSTKIYTTPQQRTWVGLTDKEIWQLVNDCTIGNDLHADKFARAIEAKLKEKNI